MLKVNLVIVSLFMSFSVSAMMDGYNTRVSELEFVFSQSAKMRKSLDGGMISEIKILKNGNYEIKTDEGKSVVVEVAKKGPVDFDVMGPSEKELKIVGTKKKDEAEKSVKKLSKEELDDELFICGEKLRTYEEKEVGVYGSLNRLGDNVKKIEQKYEETSSDRNWGATK